MNARSYIFGNPTGWALYEGDASENDYFKSFYVSRRRGDRLMVNRRPDGSVVYTYINYELCESSERCGASHFGMAIILDNFLYTPDFDTIYRFMRDAFQRLVDRDDSPFTPFGDKLRYTITKLSDAETPIEWLKAILPKILDKVSIKVLDRSLGSGQAGVMATLPDTALSTDIENAFFQYSWVIISPIFAQQQRDSNENDNSTTDLPEISLRDLDIQNKEMVKHMLDMALDKVTYSWNDIKELTNMKDDSRALLITYLRSEPDEDEKKYVKRILEDYSQLQSRIEDLERKLKSKENENTEDASSELNSRLCDEDKSEESKSSNTTIISNSNIRSNRALNSIHGRKNRSTSDPKYPISPKDEIPLYMWIILGVIVIGLVISLIIGVRSCSKESDIIEEHKITSDTVIIDPIEEETFQNEYTENQNRVLNNLWDFAMYPDAKTGSEGIQNCFESEKVTIESLSDNDENRDINKWIERVQLWQQAIKVWESKDWERDSMRYKEYINILNQFPAERIQNYITNANNRQNNANNKPPIQTERPKNSPKNVHEPSIPVIKITNDKITENRGGLIIDVPLDKKFCIQSDQSLSFDKQTGLTVNTKDRKTIYIICKRQRVQRTYILKVKDTGYTITLKPQE